MFHEASPRFRAWLAAWAGTRPELHDRFVDELWQLRSALEASEYDRAARLEVIREQQRHLDANAGDLAARGESIRGLEETLARAAADQSVLEARCAQLTEELSCVHAGLVRCEDESASWMRFLPGMRLRIPGGRARADQLRRLRARLLDRRGQRPQR